MKKFITILFLLLGYWQTSKYFSENPNLKIYLENSEVINHKQITKITLENGSQSIISNDIIKPIKIKFSQKILKINKVKNLSNNEIKINGSNIIINFDLLNKNESNTFFIVTDKRPKILNIDGRIRDIDDIKLYDYEYKPKPLYRFLNIWMILAVVSVILFIDALLVILKDHDFQHLKNFIVKFPLTNDNIENYISNFGEYYSKWKVKLKPDTLFMQETIRDLFIIYPHETNSELNFIKYLSNFRVEFYSQYRTRTVFIKVSPILFIISIFSIILNYFYYDLKIINEVFSIELINKIISTILLLFGIFVISFPSKTMNTI